MLQVSLSDDIKSIVIFNSQGSPLYISKNFNRSFVNHSGGAHRKKIHKPWVSSVHRRITVKDWSITMICLSNLNTVSDRNKSLSNFVCDWSFSVPPFPLDDQIKVSRSSKTRLYYRCNESKYEPTPTSDVGLQ